MSPPAANAKGTRSSWVVLGIVALSAALARIRPPADPDTGWHLKQAREFLAAGWFNYPETASFTKAGEVYTNICWIGQLAILGAFEAMGDLGLVVFSALGALLSTLLIGWMARAFSSPESSSRALAVLGAALTAGAVQWRLEARPEVLALCLFPLGIIMAERFAASSGPSTRTWVAGMLALQLLWAHSHGSFVLFPALVVIALLGTIELKDPPALKESLRTVLRTKGPAVLLLLAAVSLGPSGLDVYSVVSGVAFGDATSHIAEMRALELEWLIPKDFSSFLWLDLLLVLAVGRALWQRRLRLDDLLRLGLGMALTLTHHRFRDLWAILLVPMAVRSFASEGVAKSSPPWRERALLLSALLVIPLTVMSTTRRSPERGYGFGLSTDELPSTMAQVLTAGDAHGNLLNVFEDGGWLSLWVGDRVKTAIDGRTPGLFDDETYFLVRRAYSEPGAFQLLESSFGLDLVMTPPHAPLCARLSERPDWRAIYRTRSRVLFAKSGQLGSIRGFKVIDVCEPLPSLDRGCQSAESAEAARAELRSLVTVAPSEPYPWVLAAELEATCGDPGLGAQLALRALESGTRSAEIHTEVASILARAQSPRAREIADRAVALGGGRPALITRARLALAEKEYRTAAEDLELVAEEMDDVLPSDLRLELARSLAGLGKTELALVHARRAFWISGKPEARRLVEELGGQVLP
ncbi:MAG: hypothetical protein HY791_36995 [Deltaproteobacteria bacterium]|nr:hypothetical protein [Deltaproteobacteria bacterium]